MNNFKYFISFLICFGMILPLTVFSERIKVEQASSEEYSDTWIEAKLLTVISLNRELSIFDVNLDVNDGSVLMEGEVDSDIRRELATELAKSVDGVKEIDNRIQVVKNYAAKISKQNKRTFGQTVDDLTTTAAVKTELLTNSKVSGLSVNVDTFKSDVTLSGTVESSAESELIEQIVRNTKGVQKVDNKLMLKEQS